MKWPTWATPLLLAVALTGLNALKPAHVDDHSYLTYAREFAAHPSRPYDFEFGTPIAIPANDFLVPPVLPAWLALGMTFFGDDLLALKMWLFPFAWLLTWSLSALFRRFAPTVDEPMTCLTVLSPAILPSFNFMLEIPVLALQLSALVLTLNACDRGRWAWLIGAGLVAGLAMQTKYTAFATLGAMTLGCLLSRRPAFAIVAPALALGVFAGWETFVAQVHGESHFAANFQQRREAPFARFVHLALPLVANIGGLMPAAMLLGLAALGWSNRLLGATAAAMVGGFLALAFVPDSIALWGKSAANGKFAFSFFQMLFGTLGILTCAVVVHVVLRSRRTEWQPIRKTTALANANLFLLGWLLAEIGWYFAVTPFPAARRVLGIAIVATVMMGRLADRTSSTWGRRGWVWSCTLGGAALGLLFFVTDWMDADAGHQAAVMAALGEFQPDSQGTAWYVDLHGFGEACHRQGLKLLSMQRTPPQPGDVIFVVDTSINMAGFVEKNLNCQRIGAIEIADVWPLRVYMNYYAGSAPLRHLEGPRLKVDVFRVQHDMAPSNSSP